MRRTLNLIDHFSSPNFLALIFLVFGVYYITFENKMRKLSDIFRIEVV